MHVSASKEFQNTNSNMNNNNYEDDEGNDNNFCFDTTSIIAGYAFDVYNPPPLGKTAIGTDGTSIIFTETDFIRQMFNGVVLITIKDLIMRKYEKEQFIESLMTGSNPDYYIQLILNENNYSSNNNKNTNKRSVSRSNGSSSSSSSSSSTIRERNFKRRVTIHRFPLPKH